MARNEEDVVDHRYVDLTLAVTLDWLHSHIVCPAEYRGKTLDTSRRVIRITLVPARLLSYIESWIVTIRYLVHGATIAYGCASRPGPSTLVINIHHLLLITID